MSDNVAKTKVETNLPVNLCTKHEVSSFVKHS